MTSLRMQLIIACIFLLRIASVYGQDSPDNTHTTHYWAQYGTVYTSLGPGLTGNLTLDRNNHLFTLGMNGTSLRGFTRDTWEISFYYGRGERGEHLHLSAGVGVAVIGGNTYSGIFGGEITEQMEPMISFPLRGEIAWIPNRFIAPVIYGFLNVNTNQSIGGIGLTLRFGNIR